MVVLIDRKKEPTLCVLCKQNYDKEQHKPECLIPCGHTYCKACINKFDNKKKTCPLCKMYFNQVIPDYEMMDIISVKKQEQVVVEKITRPVTAKVKSPQKVNNTVSENEIIEEDMFHKPTLKLQNSTDKTKEDKVSEDEVKGEELYQKMIKNEGKEDMENVIKILEKKNTCKKLIIFINRN